MQEYFGLSKYKVTQLVEDGVLAQPIKEPKRAAYWTRKQILDAEYRIEERAVPLPEPKRNPRTRGFNANQIAQMRAHAGL